MDSLSDYEKRRLKNIAENKRILKELGLDKPFIPHSSAFKKPPAKKQAKRKRVECQKPRKELAIVADTCPDEAYDGRPIRRRSARLLGKEAPHAEGLADTCIDEEYEEPKKARDKEVYPNIIGTIPGIPIGKWWDKRQECCEDRVHRLTVAGIHGNEREGAFSVALSGGYEDDVDYGEYFTYTGEGGRDLKGTKAKPKNLRTADQSRDQTWSRGNSALVKSVETGLPVRVIRGYKLQSPFAPEEGYRYDGLYKVEKWWIAIGLKGFKVFKFAMKRCENQGPPPWEEDTQKDATEEGNKENMAVGATKNPDIENKEKL